MLNIPLNILHVFDRFNVVAGKTSLKGLLEYASRVAEQQNNVEKHIDLCNDIKTFKSDGEELKRYITSHEVGVRKTW